MKNSISYHQIPTRTCAIREFEDFHFSGIFARAKLVTSFLLQEVAVSRCSSKFVKKRLQHGCFPLNTAKFLGTDFCRMSLVTTPILSGLQRMSSSEIDELLANDPAHHACQEEYRQLKNEFELYKRKNVLQKYTDKDKLSEEVVKYKKRIENLEELLRKQNKHFEESEKENSQIISQLQIDVTNLNDIYKRKVDDVKEEYKKYLGQADEELKKQRLRTMTLLNEKDIEIERLQQRLYENDDRPIISKIENEKQKNEIENETVVDEILSSPSVRWLFKLISRNFFWVSFYKYFL